MAMFFLPVVTLASLDAEPSNKAWSQVLERNPSLCKALGARVVQAPGAWLALHHGATGSAGHAGAALLRLSLSLGRLPCGDDAWSAGLGYPSGGWVEACVTA